jgi:hypothetical protein
MNAEGGHAYSSDVASIVAGQLGRIPRMPWRVAAHCVHGMPTVIVSPPVLADGTPFPTYAWLTCPHLAERMSAEESEGAAAGWVARARADAELAEQLRRADAAVREVRRRESGGVDPCRTVGLAGQREPLGVKCLHAHVALALIGIPDPIGTAEIGKVEPSCPDARCKAIRE